MSKSVLHKIAITFCFITTMNIGFAQNTFYDIYLLPEKEDDQDLFSQINSVEFYNELKKFNDDNKNTHLEKRSDYTYKIDSIVIWDKDASFQWFRLSKSEFFREDHDLKEINLGWNFDFVSDQFKADSYSVYTYNKNDLLEKQTFNIWSGIYHDWNEENPELIRKFTYNKNKQLIRYEDQSALAIQTNRIDNLDLFEYNSLGLPYRFSHYFWSSQIDTFLHTRETIYKHNENDELAEIVNWKFNTDRGWEYVDSILINYKENGQVEKETTYTWSLNDGFKPYAQKVYRYYNDGSLDEVATYYSYDVKEDNWETANIEVYGYHNYGSLYKITNYDSLSFDVGRDKVFKIKYSYDENLYKKQIKEIKHKNLLPIYKNDFLQNHMLLESDYFDGGGTLHPERFLYQARYHYSELETSSISDNDIESAVKVYPNPVVDQLSFEVPKDHKQFDVSLSDLQGKIMLKDRLINGDQLSLKHLENGVYIYTLTFGSHVQSGKVVKVEQ